MLYKVFPEAPMGPSSVRDYGNGETHGEEIKMTDEEDTHSLHPYITHTFP